MRPIYKAKLDKIFDVASKFIFFLPKKMKKSTLCCAIIYHLPRCYYRCVAVFERETENWAKKDIKCGEKL